MNEEMRDEFIRLLPVVFFLTFALCGVMVISAYYFDQSGYISLRSIPDEAVVDVES